MSGEKYVFGGRNVRTCVLRVCGGEICENPGDRVVEYGIRTVREIANVVDEATVWVE